MALHRCWIGTEVTASGVREPVTTLPPPLYETFSLPNSSQEHLDLLIQFSSKRKLKDALEYVKATVSYNTLTVSADRLRFNPRSFRLKAEKNIFVEYGDKHVHAKSVEIELKAGEPIIKVISK